MRVTTAFNRMLRLPGASVKDVAFGSEGVVVTVGRGYDVRDVCPNRTGRQDRARQRGKSDTLDSERIARETLGHPLLPRGVQALRR